MVIAPRTGSKVESKTEHTRKACATRLVTFGCNNSLISVVTEQGKSSGYATAQLSDAAWEADFLPLNYTRFSGGYASLGYG
jgi:hypothetical protein